SMGNAPSELSIVNVTSARPSGARPAVPAKMTSSIFPPRRSLAPWVPITHRSASRTFDLPEPFGPTTHVMPGSNRNVVADANDLKPLSVRLSRYTRRRPFLHEAGNSIGRCYPAALTSRGTTPGRGRARSLADLPLQPRPSPAAQPSHPSHERDPCSAVGERC